MKIIVRDRILKTIPSSKSGSNEYIMLRVWCDGSQYSKCLNRNIYKTNESIEFMERDAVRRLEEGNIPFDWTLQFVPKRVVVVDELNSSQVGK